MSVDINEIDTDVLVIGGGAAGLWAAIRAKDLCPKVVLVDKSKVARSGASTFIHGILAPLPEENLYPAMKEIVEQGQYMCDQKCLEIVFREHGERIKQMESWAVPFLRDSSGKLYTRKGRMHEVNNAIYASGVDMMEKMKEYAISKGVVFVERVMITDLLTSDGQHPTTGQVVGAVGFHTRNGQFHLFKSRAVVLASGPMSSKLHVAFSDNLTGDGYAMAFRAGAELCGMEFGQQPYFPVWGRKFSGVPPGTIQTYGGQPINRLGERILEKYFPGRTPQTVTRTQFGYAMAKETLEGRGPIYLDLRHLSDEIVDRIRKVLPSDMRTLDEEGIDLRKQQLEAVPVIANWFANLDGGVRKDINGASNIPGLLAAGAAAHEAVNPADSSGVSQAGCYTSGYRAGGRAGRVALNVGQVKINRDQAEGMREKTFSPLGRNKGPKPEDIYTAIKKVTLPAELSFFKHERRIKTTLAEIKRVQEEEVPQVKADDIHELVKANEARNFAQVAEVAYQCALERKESRLCHYREEFPYRDDVEWLKWVIAKRDTKGIAVRSEYIPIEDYPIKPSRRSRIPAPVQFSLERGK